jgi:hypothetical protein
MGIAVTPCSHAMMSMMSVDGKNSFFLRLLPLLAWSITGKNIQKPKHFCSRHESLVSFKDEPIFNPSSE